MNDLYQSAFDLDGRLFYPNREYAIFDAVDQYSDPRSIYDSYNKQKKDEEVMIKSKYDQLVKGQPSQVEGAGVNSAMTGNVIPTGQQRWRLPVVPQPAPSAKYAQQATAGQGKKSFSFNLRGKK